MILKISFISNNFSFDVNIVLLKKQKIINKFIENYFKFYSIN